MTRLAAVPEPTDEMAQAGAEMLSQYLGQSWRKPVTTTAVISAAIAAAPPEFLLRAALTERELKALTQAGSYTYGDSARAIEKLSRALRGGEETNG